MSKCQICEGSGYINVPHKIDTRMMCRCTLEALYRRKLGREIFDAAPLSSSEYTSLVDKNVFITSTRRDFLPHLRYAAIDQGLNYFLRVTNDSQMLDAWLSKERAHSQKEGTTQAVDFTSLRDLVEDPQLLVIFLGIVSYGNRALPGILLETIRIRIFEGRPTWIVNPHVHPFNAGHFCYSPDVEEQIALSFEKRRIEPSVQTTSLYEGVKLRETKGHDTGGNRIRRKKIDLDLNKLM